MEHDNWWGEAVFDVHRGKLGGTHEDLHATWARRASDRIAREHRNLSFQTTESDIRDAFGKFGNVESVAIINDRDTGRSKGFGFVEMSEDDANKAIAAMRTALNSMSEPLQ